MITKACCCCVFVCAFHAPHTYTAAAFLHTTPKLSEVNRSCISIQAGRQAANQQRQWPHGQRSGNIQRPVRTQSKCVIELKERSDRYFIHSLLDHSSMLMKLKRQNDDDGVWWLGRCCEGFQESSGLRQAACSVEVTPSDENFHETFNSGNIGLGILFHIHTAHTHTLHTTHAMHSSDRQIDELFVACTLFAAFSPTASFFRCFVFFFYHL